MLSSERPSCGPSGDRVTISILKSSAHTVMTPPLTSAILCKMKSPIKLRYQEVREQLGEGAPPRSHSGGQRTVEGRCSSKVTPTWQSSEQVTSTQDRGFQRIGVMVVYFDPIKDGDMKTVVPLTG